MTSKIAAVCFLSLALLTRAGAAEKGKVPGESELKTLTRDSLLAFNKAVAAKDFSGFIKEVSELWQGQVTAKQLTDVFKSFIDQQIDIAFISSSEPVFDKTPAIDKDGVLALEGHYPTKPNKVQFRLKYIYEKRAWKLLGITVNVTPAGTTEAPLPPENEIRALVKDSLGNFNQAVEGKDFTEFYGQIAAVWQKQTTPAKLQKLFQSFIDQEVDLAPALKLKAAFDPAPALTEDGIIIVSGSLPSEPSQVKFELGYIFESPAWKLVKINVKIGPAAEGEKDE
ncbi:MAG: hypothetical protein ACXV97_06975 [Chthoniobacterales bacterium]